MTGQTLAKVNTSNGSQPRTHVAAERLDVDLACGGPQRRAHHPRPAAAAAAKYSGRSVSIGTGISEAGVAIETVAAHAGHKSLNVAQKYGSLRSPRHQRVAQ